MEMPEDKKKLYIVGAVAVVAIAFAGYMMFGRGEPAPVATPASQQQDAITQSMQDTSKNVQPLPEIQRPKTRGAQPVPKR